MDEETTEVLEPEFVSNDEIDTSSKLANVAIAGAALVGVATGVRFVARKLPWTITIGRKNAAPEIPEITEPVDAPVVNE